ncbi:MAG: hypothetical protein EHM43_06760, partial [Ignavibacteriae bacterium]
MRYFTLRVSISLFGCFLLFTFSAKGQVLSEDLGLHADLDIAVPFTSLNSSADDYGPSWDGARKRLTWTTSRSGAAEIWVSDAEGTAVRKAEGTFNASGRYRSYVTFGRDGEAVGVAFLRGERQSYPTIVTVPLDNDQINLGHPVASLSGETFTSQPTLSPDGTRLVFVSDRPGGVGKLDLWVCDRRGQVEWSEPVLLSALVNSPDDEITPTFISNDSLVYASNGYGGKGGFDLFLIVLREGAWQEPEPL